MPLDIVSSLGTAYTILSWIVSAVQAHNANKEQLGVLVASTKQLLSALNTEFNESRLAPEKCAKPLEDLETLLRDIHRFVENEKESGFLKMLFQRDARAFKIEAFHKRIGGCINAFQISSLLNIQTIENHALHPILLNSSSTFKEINQNNTIAMMVSLQKQLNNQSIDRAEQKFYTHTLEYLTSRSGKVVKVEDWMIASFEVDYGEEIGAGGFGMVYRGTWNRTEVAIKVLRNEAGIKPSPVSLRNEIDIWSTLRHPNIVQFLGANTLDDKPFIVMSYVEYNAKEFLRTRPEFDPLYILLDIALGLEYLHSRKICHGDLKAINVLVENSGRALLCDFGLARLKADVSSRSIVTNIAAPQIQGSRNWMAPELLNGSRLRMPSDVYAFSMTLYELYTNEIPLFSVPYDDLVDLVARRGGRPERPEEEDGGRFIPDEVWELAEQCWVADPHNRPTATQIHDAIKHILSHLPQEQLNELTPTLSLAPTPPPRVIHSLPSFLSSSSADDEQCRAIYVRSLPQATGTFIVTSSNDNVKLHLTAQEDKIELPVYGTGGVLAGIVELTKTENISSVEVKVEGRVKVHEVGESGRAETTISVGHIKLWSKADNNLFCPSSLPFSVTLPTRFQEGGRSCPLPPSHSAYLEGVPGFHAYIDYSASVHVNAKKKFGLSIGSTTVSTPFIYQSRSRPAHPIPVPLNCGNAGFIARQGWKLYSSVAKANPSEYGIQDVAVKFYIPESRVFWVGSTIPFHVTFEGTLDSLAWFRSYGPTGELNGPRLQLIRQSSADVRGTVLNNIKTNIWRRDSIGEGVFWPAAAEGATRMSFSGEVPIEPIKVTGFQLRHFSVRDWLMMTAPDVTKSPFAGFREAIPVQLTTDAWVEDGDRVNP
ncbi:Kinase-like protein [Mycena venus]|uniref:Kinase-like protein n=1 Tax=Mycena venus TaxID=2733690 RepID=A0A8H6XE34_9AGAR|nr:Kinase-like protein [Mycena venus]